MSEEGLPTGWILAPLDEVATVHDDLREPVNADERAKRLGPYPYYGATGQVGWIDDFLMDGEYILLGEDGAPFLDPSKPKAYRVIGKSWVNNHAHVLRGVECLTDNRYLMYALNHADYRGYANGTTRLKLTQSAMRKLPIRLAPPAEQRLIVAKVEELFSDLDAGVAALERARANLKRYRAAVLKAAVAGELTADWRAADPKVEPVGKLLSRIVIPPRPARYASRSKDIIPGHPALSVGPIGTPLPPGWLWCPLTDVARMESGHTPSRNHPEWWDGDISWVGILDAKAHHGGVINETLQHTNRDGLENSAARLLPTGTVCVSRTAASIGYVTILGRPMATSQDFVNWVPTEAVRSDWLRLVFMVDREVLVRFGKGSTHKTVYFPEWLSLHIAVPPLAEQEEIVTEVERKLSVAAATVDYIAASIRRATRLRQSILKEAFAGRLVRQDPADEPVSVLLDRIRQARSQADVSNGASHLGRKRGRRLQADLFEDAPNGSD